MFSANCTARLKQAETYIRTQFAGAVAKEQGEGQNVLDAAALQRFLDSAAAPLALDGLDAQVEIIADRKKPLPDRKAAREKALRLVRPVLAALDGNAAVQHYLGHPFGNPPKDLRMAQTN